MYNFIEEMDIKGHLQIEKMYNDGTKEIVFDDHNIIVSGMSVGLSYLFTLSGSNTISDYQFDRFQLGVSGDNKYSTTEVSGTYGLSGPLSSTEEYVGTVGDLVTTSSTQIKNGVDQTGKVFALIPFKNVTRINDTSVRYTIIIDKESCNNLTRSVTNVTTNASLNEIGLFMKNPRGNHNDASILSAFRVFSDIRKTSDFALIFRWTINL